MLKKPKFVVFDYGETLVHEDHFLPIPGFEAMLQHAVKNPNGYTADDLAAMFADAFQELRWKVLHTGMEVPHIPRMRWLTEICDLEFDLSEQGVEKIFWDGAAPGYPTPRYGESSGKDAQMRHRYRRSQQYRFQRRIPCSAHRRCLSRTPL